jgi:DNA-binding transcriptional ArsR family regulator
VTTYGAVLDVLGDPTRRAIVERLRSGPLAVVDLAEDLPVSRPAVSQHLRVLADAGLVTYRATGNRNVYRLRPQGIEPLRAWLDDFWQGPLERFRDHVVAIERDRP